MSAVAGSVRTSGRRRTLRGQTAIVGIGTTPMYTRGTSDESSVALVLRAILAACVDAGVDPRDIDGFVSYGGDENGGLTLGASLGVREIRSCTMVWGGGGGGIAAALNTAAMTVATGQAECVAVYRGITEADHGRGSYGKGHFDSALTAHGIVGPAQICALRTQRMLTHDQVPASALAALVQVSYEHAQNNPDAVAYGMSLPLELYRDARWIVEPFRLYDCSRENDGAAAVLVMAAERAAELDSLPAYILSGVQGSADGWGEQLENDVPYTSAGFHPQMVERLWRDAEITAGDVDVAQVYENFSGPAVAALIDLGFCPPGPAAGEFVTVANLRAPDGRLPINTSGGNLAEGFIHGIGLMLEAVRQIRGSSCNQVAGADVSLLIGGPGAPLVSATVLGSAATL